MPEAMRRLPTRIYFDSDVTFVAHLSEIRGSLWKILLFLPDVADPSCTAECEQHGFRMFQVAASFYRSFVETQNPTFRSHTHADSIEKDITRTFPRHILFRPNGIGTGMLRAVLRAYAHFDEQVGYCQGMNFVAGFLLLHYEPRVAFCCLAAMFHDPRFLLREMFLPHFPLVQKLNEAFHRLMKKYLPGEITRKFESLGLVSSMMDAVTTQWWMTLLVNALPTEYTMKVWDNFLSLGWNGIFSSVLGLIIAQQETIKKLGTLQSATEFLQHHLCAGLPDREPKCIPFVLIRRKDKFLPTRSQSPKSSGE
ncbi:rab-like GTPase activating protein [Perkinsela sp. CCAP 1560/4]|nr:rab-like GTPase activating protein [Perkinsela sp. CCAP 1560/4]|eukprot:KNH08997.1 rab-like GTPase activating protein [Perkinsela sp. CCAP 1560/4]